MSALYKFGRLWRTMRHLKLVQITNRLRRKILPAVIDGRPAPVLRQMQGACVRFLSRTPRFSVPDVFTFLNVTAQVGDVSDWNAAKMPKLWLYNLHYFDWLMQDGRHDLEAREATIARWIAENPPGHGNGWEPYPISLRVVNWIKWAIAGRPLSEQAIQSLAVQVRFLVSRLEYHLLGNHLFANAKALYAAGCFFEGTEAERWRQLALEILAREFPEQILPDGGHFELSPVYHATIFEDVLDMINLGSAYTDDVPLEWRAVAARMGRWLKIMTRADGLVPLFNDAAYGVAADTDELLSYAARLGCALTEDVGTGLHWLGDSGYFRYDGVSYQCFGDVGAIGPDYIPGHAHADMLNFELVVGACPLIVDTGTSIYAIGDRRAFERGTEAHNCVQLGDLDQSEMWAGFRVGRRARIVDRRVEPHRISAGHDGYATQGVIHHRSFAFDTDSVTITDQLSAVTSGLPAVARFHLAPGCAPEMSVDSVDLGRARLSFTGHRQIRLVDYDCARGFNDLVPARCVEVLFDTDLNTVIAVANEVLTAE